MKKIIFISTIVITFALSACNKTRPEKELHCIGNNICMKDTFIQVGTASFIDTNCQKMDGANIRNVQAVKTKFSLNEEIAINLDAVGINNSATGTVMFASSYMDKNAEVLTFMQYDVCKVSSDVLTNVPCIYHFTPKEKGEYHFTFVNVYGDFSKISVIVD
jgi:hypothetical protein